MKIAVLASNYMRIPPEPGFVPRGDSGGPERIMYLITEELVRRGHDVTLFASGDSKTNAKLVSVSEKSSILDPEIGDSHHADLEHLLISKCYQMALKGEFDLIHSLFDIRSAYYAGLVSTPTISTLHSPIVGIKKIILSKLPRTQHYVSISNRQRLSLPTLNYIATIYHGIEVTNFPYGEGEKDTLLFAGRIAPEKGVDQVITVAKRLNKSCYILGDYAEKKEEYWNTSIAPYIDNLTIFHMGFVHSGKLYQYYKDAKLFLFPIQWEEPFGLVMIEAMACGTPVVAYAKGSVPELVVDGVTGFIVNPSDNDKRGDFIIKKTGIDGLNEAAERIYSLQKEDYQKMRQACRKHVEQNFTVEKMVDEYEKVYQEVIKRQR